MILPLFNLIAALITLMLSPLLVHLSVPLWKSTTALSAMPHLISRLKFLKNLLMMSPRHCHLVFLSPVHRHRHHHHHSHYAPLHLCSTPGSKHTCSINPSHRSPPHLFGRISRIFVTISRLNFATVFLFCFSLFIFCLNRVILSWFNQLLNCMLNPCTFLFISLFGHLMNRKDK